MKTCSHRQFVNQQDYLDTVCKNRCHECRPKPLPPKCGKRLCCTYENNCGKIRVTQDCCKTDVDLKITIPREPPRCWRCNKKQGYEIVTLFFLLKAFFNITSRPRPGWAVRTCPSLWDCPCSYLMGRYRFPGWTCCFCKTSCCRRCDLRTWYFCSWYCLFSCSNYFL